jgi:phage terminase large subunit-like protein
MNTLNNVPYLWWLLMAIFGIDDLADELDQALFPSSAVVTVDPGNIIDWAEDRFYVVETKRPIVFQPVQKAVLQAFTQRRADGRFRWKTLLYSTIKKSGKTTIAAVYQRWAAEKWGDYGEIYHLGNKQAQAKERAFKITRRSVELAPIHEQAEWELQTTRLTHLPTHSYIDALPVNASGEAGGNQRLTTWTEFHGYTYEENNRMWSELQPVPTQFLSQRFVESYAGYKGESVLLESIWNLAKAGEKLSDEFPIWGNETAALCAYIDTGEAARRMPWQQGQIGREYYAEQEAIELPHEYQRIHLNEWVGSQNKLIPLELWDRLKVEPIDPLSHLYRGGFMIAAADASVSGDSTGLAVGMYFQGIVYVIEAWEWIPPKGGKLDYDETIKLELRSALERYAGRLVRVVYDEYQLHDCMTSLSTEYEGVEFEAFDQGARRVESDTMLVSRIRQEKLRHSGQSNLRSHIDNADGKASSDKKLRIVKRENTLKIDLTVALSMLTDAAFREGELPDEPPVQQIRVRDNRRRRGD